MIRKFKCEVTSVSEYEIEIDEEEWNAETIAEWSRTFTDVDNLEDIAGILAKYKTFHADGEFIEGFGIPLINGKRPAFADERSLATDININKIYENDMDVDVVEIKDKN